MAVSGTVTFNVTQSEIISAALRLCGVLDPEVGTASTNQLTYGTQALNMMLKSWEAYGLQLFQRRYGVIFPQLNQEYYVLGSPGPSGDHACLSTPLGSGFVSTTLSSAIAASGTSAVCAAISTTGTVGVPAITIASGWYIGIEQTDGTRFWTTVSGSPSGTTCTLTSGLSVGAAAGATVFSYQTKLIKPLRVLDGFTRQIEGNDVPHLMISREQYNRFGMKSSAGTSIQAYYDSQRDSGNYYVYPTTQDVSNLIYIEFQKPFDDMSGSTQNMDVPQEWIEAIKWGLAMRLAPEYGVPKEKLSFIKGMADQALALVDGWDQEPTSLLLQPDQWAYTPGYTGSNK